VQEDHRANTINTLASARRTLLATAWACSPHGPHRRERHAAHHLLDFSNTASSTSSSTSLGALREITIAPMRPNGPKLLKAASWPHLHFLRPNDLSELTCRQLPEGDKRRRSTCLLKQRRHQHAGPITAVPAQHLPRQRLRRRGRDRLRREARPLEDQAPAFIYGSREDHIVPWKGLGNRRRSLGGKNRFVLGASATSPPHQSPQGQQAQPLVQREAADVADAWLPAHRAPASGVAAVEVLGGRARLERSARPRAAQGIEAAPGRYVQQKA